ncbi:MAG: pyridoxal-phosphate dependent enzyme, partial [Anaerolineales bacterium]|nr:pyridoxal-phosphate dependent enzyme [Anaerolineales bacterium]
SAEGGVNGAVQVAQEMATQSDEYFVPDQFGNSANPLAHYETTGPEILADMGDLKINVFIAGIGTGGTITGVGRRLRENCPSIKIIGVEPFVDDPIQGLRSLKAGFVPPIIDLSIMDERPEVSNKDASIAVVKLLQQEGIFAGISSGVVIHQAIETASQMDSGNIVVVLPDGGFKYLSTNSYE